MNISPLFFGTGAFSTTFKMPRLCLPNCMVFVCSCLTCQDHKTNNGSKLVNRPNKSWGVRGLWPLQIWKECPIFTLERKNVPGKWKLIEMLLSFMQHSGFSSSRSFHSMLTSEYKLFYSIGMNIFSYGYGMMSPYATELSLVNWPNKLRLQ